MPSTGQTTLRVSLVQAWNALGDAALLQACLPVPGTLRMVETHPPRVCRIALEADGLEGVLQLRLEPLAPTQSLLHATLVCSGEGPKARERRAQALLDDVLAALATALRQRHPAQAVVAPQPLQPLGRRLLGWYLGWLGRIFTGKL